MSVVAKVEFTDYEASVTKALDLIEAAGKLPQTGLVIIKPNLTNADAPPVTTNVKAAEAVYKYCSSHSKADIATLPRRRTVHLLPRGCEKEEVEEI